jgi:16S rRNA (adenine(1408)-N(1))-methyltransferase
VVVDIGTGDGRFVLAAARRDPSGLFVGIDADAPSMVESSRRAARRDALPNALFVVAAAEALPTELYDAADEVTVHFPWGSLLRGLVDGEPDVAGQLSSVAASRARVNILLSARPSDRLPWLPRVDAAVASRVGDRFAAHGFETRIARPATPDEVAAARSSWAKRLAAGASGREVWRIAVGRPGASMRLPVRQALDETGRP